MYHYNITGHTSTWISPFQLTFGRDETLQMARRLVVLEDKHNSNWFDEKRKRGVRTNL